MRNAKEEFLHAVKNLARVKCAYVWIEDFDDKVPQKSNEPIVLKLNYTDKDFSEFVNKLDFEYDGGYGIQTIYGTVWLEDGTWVNRGEYDGSEWWEHHKCPDIPEKCSDV